MSTRPRAHAHADGPRRPATRRRRHAAPRRHHGDALLPGFRVVAIGEGESFTSIDLKATFLRPVWRERLRATARAVQAGRTLSHYVCEIVREDGKPVASVASAVMTLRGERAQGR